MKYELAKKLKDAGFPLDKGGMFYEGLNGMAVWESELPTLSELIEACGEHFVELKKIVNEHGIVWRATGNYNPKNAPDWGYSMAGSTPEEAVVNLWLELNTK